MRAIAIPVLALLQSAAVAQYPRWADDKVFNLSEVEVCLRYPPSGPSFPGMEIRILGDGTIVRRIGADGQHDIREPAGSVDRREVFLLLERFLQLQFFELPAAYKGGATVVPVPNNPLRPLPERFRISAHHVTMDATFIELTLRIGKHRKTVTSWDQEGPAQLQEIAVEVERLAGTDRNRSPSDSQPREPSVESSQGRSVSRDTD